MRDCDCTEGERYFVTFSTLQLRESFALVFLFLIK
jgi:hypothetical protein